MLRVFAAAWRFLTVFPFPLLSPGPDEAALLSRALAAFPVVGAALGLCCAGCVWLIAGVLPVGVAAVVAVALLAGCSAGLHLDGIADSADGLLSPGRSREKILEVMRDSRIGAHGAVAVTLILLLKAASLSSLPPTEMALTVFVMPIAGRAAMAFPICLLPYARADGLGSAFTNAGKRPLAHSCVWTAGGMLLAFGALGGVGGAVAWLAASLAWVLFLRRRLGGGTGDTYGAACEIAETTAAVVAAAVFG